jgi:hypothetical protein
MAVPGAAATAESRTLDSSTSMRSSGSTGGAGGGGATWDAIMQNAISLRRMAGDDPCAGGLDETAVKIINFEASFVSSGLDSDRN